MDAVGPTPLGSRLFSGRSLWLRRTDGAGRCQHAPMWFVCHDGRLWCCTHAGSSRSRLAGAGQNVSVALDNDGIEVVGVGPLTLHLRPYPPAVVEAFIAKFGWNLDGADRAEGPLDELWSVAIR